MKKRISILYKIILLIICFISLLFTTGIFDNELNLRTLTMFTTLSNTIVFIYFLLDVISLIKNNKPFNSILKGIITSSITLTFLIVVIILRFYPPLDSFQHISLIGLHFIVPLMTIFDYILFSDKGNIKIIDPIYWTIFPIIYVTLTFISVHLGYNFKVMENSKYPYPFLDIDYHGIKNVAKTILIIIIIFLTISYIVYFIDKLFSKKKKK